MASIGEAVIEIRADVSRLRTDLDRQMQREGSRGGRSLGSSLTGAMTGVLRKGAMVAGGVAAAGIGTALVKGFGRLNALDQATAKLEGLGHSAKSVDTIMNSALKSVQGTAFGMGDAATIAASTVAAGVKPGKELTRTLKLVGDAATIAGTDLGDMGAIFNKIAAGGRIQGEELAQLGDRGIPILQLLGKELGVSAMEVRELAAAGKVDFATFQNAIEKGMGGAALKSGETFNGALNNMMAALGRLGATAIAPIFNALPGIMEGLIVQFDNFGPKAEQIGVKVGDFFARAVKGVSAFVTHPDTKAFASKIIEGVRLLGAFITNVALPALAALGAGVIAVVKFFRDHEIAAKALGAVVIGVLAAMAAAWTVQTTLVVVQSVKQVVAWITTATAANTSATLQSKSIAQIVFGWGVMAATAVAHTAKIVAQWVLQAVVAVAQTAISVAAVVGGWIVMAAGAMASAAVIAAAWLIALGPIGLLIAAVAAIGVALFIAYKKSETFRKLVQKVWDLLKKATIAVFNAIKAVIVKVFSAIVAVITKAWSHITKTTSTATGLVQRVVSTVFNAVRNNVTTVMRTILSVVTRVWSTIRSTTTRVWNGIRGHMSTVLDRIQSAFRTTVNKIGSIWDGLKRAAAIPVNFLINGVWNNGLYKLVDLLPGDNPLSKMNPIRLAGGGPVRGAGTETSDSIWARLSNNEFVVRAKMARKHRPLLDAINNDRAKELIGKGAFDPNARAGDLGTMYPKFERGGPVGDAASLAPFQKALAWAKAQHGKPYIWGGTGPGGFDCSGFMSGIANVIRGGSGYGTRYGTSHSFPWPGFSPGWGPFTVGASSAVGHTSGTLLGVPVESTNGSVRVGGSARGANWGPYNQIGHLGQGDASWASAKGGGGGFSLPHIGKIIDLAKEAWGAIKKIGSMGEWAKLLVEPIGKLIGEKMSDWIGDKTFGLVPGFSSGTRSAPGGVAMVGERGPELVTLPRGAGVSTAAETARVRQGHGLPRKVILRIGARDFEAYVTELADGRIDAADSLAWQGA